MRAMLLFENEELTSKISKTLVTDLIYRIITRVKYRQSVIFIKVGE